MKVVLQNLTKKYPNRNKKIGGEVTAVGDFNLISGLIKPTSGKIWFGETDVTNLPPENRGIGLVFQNYALYPHLTVRQNITFPLENLKGDKKLSREVMNDKALEAAKLVQIDHLMDRKPSELSGGQQQRVAIARALVKVPRVRCRTSTPASVCRPVRRSAASSRRPASPRSSSHMTRRRP